MRWHLLNNFDKIYILDLHGNTRKKELCPDGSKDENVFDIMQGVSINIFVKTNAKNKPTPAQINETKPPMIFWKSYSNAPECKLFHYDLYGKRKDKYKFLKENDLNSVEFKELKPKAPFYLFIPQNDELRELYEAFWSVKDIFGVCNTGIVTAHDEFVIENDKEKLLQKFTDFKNSPPSTKELHAKFNVKTKQGWDILKGWQNLQNEKDLTKYIKKIAYRPFDFKYIFYEDKLVWRCVKDTMQHFLECENVGLICCRQARASETFQHTFITSDIIEMCYISSRTTEVNYIFPLYLKTQNSQKEKTAQKPPVSSLRASKASVAKTADKSPSLAEGDLGGGSVKNAQNSTNPLNLKENSRNSKIENSNAEFTHPQTPSAREGAYLSDSAQQGALLEQEIDTLVYALYDLNESEIKLIEKGI